MRKHYKQIVKAYFCRKLILSRANLGLTQEEMAARLAMAPRSYVDLEHGKTSCSTLTLILFLVYLCDDPVKFLTELRYAFESVGAKV